MSVEVVEELPRLERGEGFFPAPNFLSVQFDVYLPFRLQAQLLQRPRARRVDVASLETFTERFRVAVHYNYHAPVAFVWPLNPQGKSYPTEAVILLREFLRRELGDGRSEYVRFEYLGPSPFHADCYVVADGIEKSRGESRFRMTRKVGRGHDEVVFHFNQSLFDAPETAMMELVEEVVRELSFFYFVQRGTVGLVNGWHRVEELVRQIIAVERVKGVGGWWMRLTGRGKAVREGVMSVAEFEAREVFFRDELAKNYRELYDAAAGKYFRVFIDERVKEPLSFPARQVIDLLGFLERRALGGLENSALLVSAVVGGVIGAVVAMVLSR